MHGTRLAILLGTTVGLCFVASLIAFSRRRARAVDEGRDWPAAEATIQSASIERAEVNAPELPWFRFSYAVDGTNYSGRFSVAVTGPRAETLVKEMIDKRLTVNYDPAHPSMFMIPDQLMEGLEAEQRPS